MNRKFAIAIVALALYFAFLCWLSHEGEKAETTIILYMGFTLAFGLFALASFVRKSNLIRCILFGLAFLALIFQGGCFMMLGGIGTATGGNDVGAEKMMIPVGLGFLVAFAWCFILVVFLPVKEDEDQLKKSDQKQESSENTEN